ncbi:hypothetical protein KI387_044053 [Taxus chinensis]|uniref:Uncharacterized protein n=1 Tax=Taxus chinensis TaxID=29808 RepID=A0AA38FZI0_TAXCH|nr:hypothetical protein KI387_044053 [Taxus chinensis]
MLRQENIIPLLGDWLKGNTPCTSIETRRKILHVNLPPHSLDYDKEITLNDVVDGWLLSNILIDTCTEVNVLTLDAWVQMGRPPLQPSSNVLFMVNRTKATPIRVLKDASITIQGAKFTRDFEVLALADLDSFPSLLGHPWCYANNVDLQFNKGYIIFENKEERVIIPLTDGKFAPYVEPLSEEDLNSIYARAIQDIEVLEPSKEGIIQWEDVHFINDTTSVACDNWAHNTYEFVGCKVKSIFPRGNKPRYVRRIGNNLVPCYTREGDPMVFLRAMEEQWIDPLERRNMLAYTLRGIAAHWWVAHKDNLVGWNEIRIALATRFFRRNAPTQICTYHGNQHVHHHI